MCTRRLVLHVLTLAITERIWEVMISNQGPYSDQGISCIEVPRDDGRYTGKSELRIILVGKTGTGKSASGITILGEKKFASNFTDQSVTKECSKQKVRRNGRDIVVVDTPGLFDTDLSPEIVAKEIGRCIAVSSPGPHAILMLLHPGRYTEEERKSVEKLQEIFGKGVVKYMIVLFTRRDDLDYDETTIQNYVTNVKNPHLQELIEMCGSRYHAFNNKASKDDKERQVSMLITMIDRMVEENNGTCYTNKMYIQAEEMLKRKEAELQKKYTEELEREKLQLQQLFEEETKRMQEEMKAKEEQLRKDLKTQTKDEMEELKEKMKALLQEQEEVKKQKEIELQQNLERKTEEYRTKSIRIRDDAEIFIGNILWKAMTWLIGTIGKWVGY